MSSTFRHDPTFKATAILSRRILRIPHLKSFLLEYRPATGKMSGMQEFDSVAGWGLKPTSRRARDLACRLGVPYLALEDGFLRSLDLGVNGAQPLSLVVDQHGIYYDATRASTLELLLQDGGWESDELSRRATAGIAALKQFRLSKYNAAAEKDYSHLTQSGRPVVLIVDQTMGDASVSAGMASTVSFDRMLECARTENPDAVLVIKTHPDVVAGHKKGYLTNRIQEADVHVIADSVNPWSLIDIADRVYTVTSQLGFEALMASKAVRCFGMPFYAGWGLTQDELSCPRRSRRRSVEEVFATAYLLYARYVDPFTGKPCRFEDTVEVLAEWKRRNDANRLPTFCVGMSPWKRRTVAKFLSSSESSPRICRNGATAVRGAARQNGRVVVWASREPADLASACADAGVPLLRLEDGFLRSVGLGADFFPAASLALDAGGMYYDPSSLSDLEHLIEQGCFDATVLDRARRLRATIVQQGVTKYNVGGRADISWPTGQRRLLVPGQVEDDRSIQCGSPLVSTNLDLLTRVRAENPDAFIVYKPHPDIAAGHRRGAIPDHLAQQQANLVVQDVSSAALMENIDEVHTMTSLIGFEALMRGRLVATYGSPFYAGWGLTRDLLSTPRRTREASLDELVAAALILYPLYVDPLTGLPCTPEVVVERLAGGQSGLSRPTTLTRLRRLMGSLRVISGRLAGI